MAYRDVMTELVTLLADPTHQGRIMAARAIAYAGREEGALLLRLKILTGDRSDDVTAECLLALANLSRVKALPFIQTYLASRNPALAEAAAMALGEMRHESALNLLLEEWQRSPFPQSRQTLTLPVALSRLPQSVDFLINVLTHDPEPVAAAALEALAIYRHDGTTSSRIHTALKTRNSQTLGQLFQDKFSP
jgi:hypothetical protein